VRAAGYPGTAAWRSRHIAVVPWYNFVYSSIVRVGKSANR
jgi:hypothetical protein